MIIANAWPRPFGIPIRDVRDSLAGGLVLAPGLIAAIADLMLGRRAKRQGTLRQSEPR